MTAAEKHAEYQTALIANDTASMNALWSEYLALVELEMRAKKNGRTYTLESTAKGVHDAIEMLEKKRANENEINLLLHQAG